MRSETEHFLRRFDLLSAEKTFVIGFSGGYDSTCLLNILDDFSKKYGFKLVALHLNHNWRGIEAEQEKNACEKFCKEKNIEFVTETLNENTKKTETAAREERFKFFKKYYKKYNADGLFLAHNKSDNTETVLYRIAKGTGVKGLCGISEHNEIDGMKIYRPILEFSREEIEDYIKQENLRPNFDSSNENIKYKRNFIRKEILPIFKEINPEIDDAVFHLSKVAVSYERIVQEFLKRLRKEIYKDGILQTKLFLGLSIDLQTKFVMDFLIGNGLDYDKKKIYETLDFINENSSSKTGKTLSLTSDLWLFVSSKEIYLFTRRQKPENEAIVEQPGEYHLYGCMVKIAKYEGEKPIFPKEDEKIAYVSNLTFPLSLRFRRDGDRISPFGMKGSMSLKKFFINRNVAQNVRDGVILLCKNNDVLWAAGHCVSEKLRVSGIPEYKLEVIDYE